MLNIWATLLQDASTEDSAGLQMVQKSWACLFWHVKQHLGADEMCF